MADLVFAFDPALDRPIPVPEGAPPLVGKAILDAPMAALRTAVLTARQSQASALVLCGRILDPLRASPAQAQALRLMITDLAANACRTVWITDTTTACAEIFRMLGEPSGLIFVAPLRPVTLTIRGLNVEIVLARTPLEMTPLPTATNGQRSQSLPLQHRVAVGWDLTACNFERWDSSIAGSDRPAHGMTRAASHSLSEESGRLSCVWGSRHHESLPPEVHPLPALQARSAHEGSSGSCATLTFIDHAHPRDETVVGGYDPHSVHLESSGNWKDVLTYHVAWRSVSVDSPLGGDEELALAIWSALEGLDVDRHARLQIIRCVVGCGTSVARRLRVAEIAAETLARLHRMCSAGPFQSWCQEILADPNESLLPLGHSRSGGKPGSTTSFSTALADIVLAIEQSPHATISPSRAREAGWMALELIEST